MRTTFQQTAISLARTIRVKIEQSLFNNNYLAYTLAFSDKIANEMYDQDLLKVEQEYNSLVSEIENSYLFDSQKQILKYSKGNYFQNFGDILKNEISTEQEKEVSERQSKILELGLENEVCDIFWQNIDSMTEKMFSENISIWTYNKEQRAKGKKIVKQPVITTSFLR